METGLSSRRTNPPGDCPTAQANPSIPFTLEVGAKDAACRHHNVTNLGGHVVPVLREFFKSMPGVFTHNFGCRASQSDGAAIEASLEERGYTPVQGRGLADLIVVNTCTVTHAADVDARRFIRGLHRDHPQARILVTGCYAQRAPEELSAIDGVTWVVGNSHKSQIADIATGTEHGYHGQVIIGDISALTQFSATPVNDIRADRTRPNLKVQDGCSNRCSFCIIPSVRGRSRSASLESILSQVSDLSRRYCEVVLSGINLGRWGRDLPGRLRFIDLLRAILAHTPIRRLRISSVEPMDWSDDLIHLVADEPRIARHMHIPLQSGSDTVLKRMFRKYRMRHYATRVELAGSLMPDAAIGADVMTGFPGETDAEFNETVRFIEQRPFTYLHVFTYSERPGTTAANLPDQVPVAVRHERTQTLRALGTRKNEEFRRKMVGRTLTAVTLEQAGVALTTNFLRVRMNQIRSANQIVDLRIAGMDETGLLEAGAFSILG